VRESLWTEYTNAPDGPARVRVRNTIVVEEMRIVHEMLRRMKMRRSADYADLVQAGTLGLMKAIERFDPIEGGWFGYASLWVRSEITDAVRQGKGHHFRAGREPDGVQVHDFFFGDMRYIETDGERAYLSDRTEANSSDNKEDMMSLSGGANCVPDLSELERDPLLEVVRDAMHGLSDHERVIVAMATDGAPAAEIALAACIRKDDVPGYLGALLQRLRDAATGDE